MYVYIIGRGSPGGGLAIGGSAVTPEVVVAFKAFWGKVTVGA